MSKHLDKLTKRLAELAPGGLCVAFSGGVDSALLLKVACGVCYNVHALTVHTPLHSPLEPKAARRMAEEFGAQFHLVEPALPDGVLENSPERCYHCKTGVFSALRAHADAHGLAHLLDGTNADDLNEYRPGLRALRELGVVSPLAELGLAKETVRALAAELELTVARKPSAPCLATRYPYGVRVELDRLPELDGFEQQVRGLGVAQVRARVDGEGLRLEVPAAQFGDVLKHREELVRAAVDAGFAGLSLDLEGFRSGSMDERRARVHKERE